MARPRTTRAAPRAEAATAEESLLAWADRRAAWARDALRRHAISDGYGLSGADKAEIVERVRHTAGLGPGEAPVCEPLSTEHVKNRDELDTRALLCSLGPVR